MPFISKDFIRNKLMPRLDIVKVIQQYRTLKLSGANYKCCCPFHNEKTPSFMVNPARQTYRCFGCGEHGNAIDFVMKYNNTTFKEAVEELARFAGLDVEYEQNSDYDPKKEDRNQALYKFMDEAAYYFTRCLQTNTEALAYFKEKRGLSEETIIKARLGFAPDSFDYVEKELVRNGDDYAVAVDCGLQKDMFEENRHRKYSFFRNRVMFPIFDTKGRIIAFGGRVLGDEKTAKYLNSPETPIFKKSREIFGLYECLQANRNRPSEVVVVEGYMDAISLRQAGYNNIVATLGTALTSEHMQKLFRYTNQVVFCFDSDEAGKKACWHAMQVVTPLLKETDKTVRFLFLPEGHDPDTFVRSKGNEAFGDEVKNALSLTETLFLFKTKEFNLAHVNGRIDFIRNVASVLKAMPIHHQVVAKQLLSEILSMDSSEVSAMVDDPSIEVAREFLPQPNYSSRSSFQSTTNGSYCGTNMSNRTTQPWGSNNRSYSDRGSSRSYQDRVTYQNNRGYNQGFDNRNSQKQTAASLGNYDGQNFNGPARQNYQNQGQPNFNPQDYQSSLGYAQGSQGYRGQPSYAQGSQGEPNYNNDQESSNYNNYGGSSRYHGDGSSRYHGQDSRQNFNRAGYAGRGSYNRGSYYDQKDDYEDNWQDHQRGVEERVIRFEKPQQHAYEANNGSSTYNQTAPYAQAGQNLSVDQFKDQLYMQNAQQLMQTPAGEYMQLGPNGAPTFNDESNFAQDDYAGEYFEGGRGPQGNIQERQDAWRAKWGPSSELNASLNHGGASDSVDLAPNVNDAQEPAIKNNGLYSYERAAYKTVVGRDFSVNEISSDVYKLIAFSLQQPTIVATLYEFFRLDDFLSLSKKLKLLEYPCIERLFELIKNERTITCGLMIEEFRDTEFWSLFNYLFDMPIFQVNEDGSELNPEQKSEYLARFLFNSLKEPFIHRQSQLVLINNKSLSSEDMKEITQINSIANINFKDLAPQIISKSA